MKDLYFISEETRLIFGLVELEGEQGMKLVGINLTHYYDTNKAKNWYEETKAKIENSEHPMKDVALANLEKLYKGMI